eukprot:COSAG05_NODE_175_length_14930_cov_7.138679_10_plen_77_part_00
MARAVDGDSSRSWEWQICFVTAGPADEPTVLATTVRQIPLCYDQCIPHGSTDELVCAFAVLVDATNRKLAGHLHVT